MRSRFLLCLRGTNSPFLFFSVSADFPAPSLAKVYRGSRSSSPIPPSELALRVKFLIARQWASAEFVGRLRQRLR